MTRLPKLSLRDLLWLMLVIAVALCWWLPNERSDSFSKQERDIYAVSLRHVINEPPTDLNGVVFLTLDNRDPPDCFLGLMFRPGSRQHMTDRIPWEDVQLEGRVCDKVTGEPGTHLRLKIIDWLKTDRVKVRCEMSVAPVWGGSYEFYLKLENAIWRFDGDDPDSHEVS